MDTDVVTKRLHISGLTPAITVDDLSRRLGSYGSVKSLDGFGKLDGLGQPRKYGYITIEGKQSQIQKCMNVLSGAVWKGTKLRVGEAKPDYQERIKREHEPAAASEPPTKRRRLLRGAHGVYASEMSLVTPTNAPTRSGWKVLPSGRLIRPVRMRPLHPLPHVAAAAVAKSEKPKKPLLKKKSRRSKPAATRARRRTIDMTRWGSTLVKGMFLEDVVADTLSFKESAVEPDKVAESSGEQSSEVAEEADSDEATDDESNEDDMNAVSQISERAPLPSTRPASAAPAPKQAIAEAHKEIPGDGTLREETKTTLSFLASLFGDPSADSQDWGGAESVDEDESHSRPLPSVTMDVDDIEEVPAPATRIHAEELSDVEDEDASKDEHGQSDEEAESITGPPSSASPGPAPAPAEPAQATNTATKLKDLFAPREEEAGFSLLGHLDLDLEFDDDLDFGAQSPATNTTDEIVTMAVDLPAPSAAAGWSFDPTDPLFFPRAPGARRGRAPDPHEGAHWAASGFYRTESDAEVRARWDREKLELTREWKRRHREAVKSRRRRGGADE